MDKIITALLLCVSLGCQGESSARSTLAALFGTAGPSLEAQQLADTLSEVALTTVEDFSDAHPEHWPWQHFDGGVPGLSHGAVRRSGDDFVVLGFTKGSGLVTVQDLSATWKGGKGTAREWDGTEAPIVLSRDKIEWNGRSIPLRKIDAVERQRAMALEVSARVKYVELCPRAASCCEVLNQDKDIDPGFDCTITKKKGRGPFCEVIMAMAKVRLGKEECRVGE